MKENAVTNNPTKPINVPEVNMAILALDLVSMDYSS